MNGNSTTQRRCATIVLCVGICIVAGLTETALCDPVTNYELAYRVDGEFMGDMFGWSLARMPDANNDGQDDLVVGAPGRGVSSTGSHLYLLAQTTQGCSTLARIDELGRSSPDIGHSVTGLTDINGDGQRDYASGAHNGEYVVWIDGANRTVGGDVSTHPGVLAMVSDPGGSHYFGSSIAALSNGQLIEASRPTVGGIGTCANWYMPAPGGGMQRKLTIRAPHHWRSDPVVRNVGDLVGNDGIDDFLIATDEGIVQPPYTGSSLGRVSLVSGALSATGTVRLADIETRHFDGPARDAVLGEQAYGEHSMATAGDFTGDGVMDFVFTTIRPYNWDGAVYFYDGATSQMLWELPGPAGVETFWSMVENLGDIDGDGGADVAISTGHDEDDGTVYFYNPVLRQYIGSFTGETWGDRFGRSVLSLGDMNGDGLGDFAVGAPRTDFTGPDAGSVYVYMSVPEPATLSLLAFGALAVLRRRRR